MEIWVELFSLLFSLLLTTQTLLLLIKNLDSRELKGSKELPCRVPVVKEKLSSLYFSLYFFSLFLSLFFLYFSPNDENHHHPNTIFQLTFPSLFSLKERT